MNRSEARRSGHDCFAGRLWQAASGSGDPVRFVLCPRVRHNLARDQRAAGCTLVSTVDPSEGSGLNKPSQVMVDKPQTFARNKIGETFGRLDNNAMLRVNRAFAVFLGFA